TVELAGLKPPVPAPRAPSFPNALALGAGKATVGPGSTITLDVTLPLEKGVKVNAEAPMPYLVETPGQTRILSENVPLTGGKISPPKQTFSVAVDLAKPPAAGDSFDLKLSLSAFVCNEGSNVCLIKSYVWTVPVKVASSGGSHIALTAK